MAHLVITPGDPTGIGPEITLKALKRIHEFPSLSLTVVGSVSALKNTADHLGLSMPHSQNITYIAVEDDNPGHVSYRSLETAVHAIKNNKLNGLVTGPIAKHNLAQAGYKAEGHTEILEKLAHTVYKDPCAKAEMLFVYNNLRMLLLTRHISIKDVPAVLRNIEPLKFSLNTLTKYLRNNCHIAKPRLAFLGLNPHAGEIGGDEEKNVFLPLINFTRTNLNADCEGPFAADGFFRDLKSKQNTYDTIIAAYHDQGLIPFKMLAGYEAVNVTIGLPFQRTSVSHGTAFDIVGRGIALESSLVAAIKVALASDYPL